MPYFEVQKKSGANIWTATLYSLMEVRKVFDINETWPK